MHRILFVCHGNICRSTMAECVMRELAHRAGQHDVITDSCATSTEELGSDIHPGTRSCLEKAHIPCGHHCARQMRPEDYARFDLIVAMDHENLDGIYRLLLG